MSHNINAWIIGAGPIGQEYAKILSHIGLTFVVIGRSEQGVASFEAATGHKAVSGGIENYLKSQPAKPDFVIIATTVNQLVPVADRVLEYGIYKIMLEKPGGMNLTELKSLQSKAKNAEIYIAYNRRYLASTRKALEIIEEDGGVSSFHFDFTEWPSRILSFEHPPGVLENWFYMNSTHVVDLAFYLGGWPTDITCKSSGSLGWHKPSAFSGTGISNRNALFSYKADWQSAGRWSVEIMTAKRKLLFAPIEQLKEQRLDDISINDIPLQDAEDKAFKPGFLRQTKELIKENPSLLTLTEQLEHWHIFDKIAGRA